MHSSSGAMPVSVSSRAASRRTAIPIEPGARRGDERSEDRQPLQEIEKRDHRQHVRADLLRHPAGQRREAADDEREQQPFGEREIAENDRD